MASYADTTHSLSENRKNKDITNNVVSKCIDLKPYDEEISAPYSMASSKKFHKDNKLGTYKMESNDKRGVLFLVNIVKYYGGTRYGANHDKKFLLELFDFMGFKIFYYEDITYAEYKNLIDQLIRSNHLDDIECFVLGILAQDCNIHNMKYVCFIDENPINIEEIYNRFNNINCKILIKKPKIFLFPICRGNVSLNGIKNVSKRSDPEPPGAPRDYISSISDMMICYAKANEFKTDEGIIEGSWYIRALYDTFCEHAHDTDFETMLNIIAENTSKYRVDNSQEPCYDNIGFFKVLYFNPGYF